MLFDISKQKSSAFIKIFVTLAIVFVPTFLNLLSVEAAVNFIFVVTSAVLLMHIKANEKINITIINAIYALLIVFGILSLIWVDNISGQITYIFGLLAVMIFANVFKIYFSESKDSSFKRRMAYLFCLSGSICAFYNFIYWITEIVPVAKNETFSKGVGTDDLLGIFCTITIFFTLSLFKNNSGFRKLVFSFSVALQIFCFLMTKSVIAWVFPVAFFALMLLNKKLENKTNNKHFIHILSVMVAYIVVLMIMLFNSEKGSAFGNVFFYALNNLFGAGGGFLSSELTFSENVSLSATGVGLFPYLFASSGFIGLVFCFVVVFRSVLFFVKSKSVESAVGVMLTVTVMLLPFGNGISSLLMLAGVDSYNENICSNKASYQLRKKQLKNITTAGLVLLVLMSSATVLSLAEMKAKRDYDNQNYSSSYELSKIVASIDFFDSDCGRIAAASIRNDKNLLNLKKDEALKMIDSAIDNDCSNLVNYEEKAKIYLALGDYESAAAQYRLIISSASVKDMYKLDLTNVLYHIVKENEKGSSTTKRAYEEILEIARSTADLEIKEKIMDIADKVSAYTKGELTDGTETMVE